MGSAQLARYPPPRLESRHLKMSTTPASASNHGPLLADTTPPRPRSAVPAEPLPTRNQTTGETDVSRRRPNSSRRDRVQSPLPSQGVKENLVAKVVQWPG